MIINHSRTIFVGENWTFPRRDRIILEIADDTIWTEGDDVRLRTGALIKKTSWDRFLTSSSRFEGIFRY